jgi:hypothetical protein
METPADPGCKLLGLGPGQKHAELKRPDKLALPDPLPPLHHLTIRSHDKPWAAAATRLLLDSGADAAIANKKGVTPAQAVPAAARGSELYRLLLEVAGA